jgi:hypothetical protein
MHDEFGAGILAGAVGRHAPAMHPDQFAREPQAALTP